MIHARKSNPRAEYRLLHNQRVNESASIAQKFPKLKSLRVDLEYYDSKGVTRNGGMTYKANLENAKTIMRFNCPSGECTGGDFELSQELAQAITSKTKVASGELRCQGVRHNKERKERIPCMNILRYKLSLGF